MSSQSVSISIVTYNDEECIGNLLDSINEIIKYEDYHIFLIDNGSRDETLQIARDKTDNITIIETKSNVGFGAGHNKVLDLIQSKYHVILNPDITFKYDVIGQMVSYLDSNPDIGMISPKILHPGGAVQILPKKDPRPIYMLARRSKLRALTKYKDEYEMTEAGADTAYDIEFASGSFMFLRTELFKKVGGFDERYFLYLEDADLSRKARQHARVQYNPSFVVYHHWQQAGAKHLKYFFIHVASMIKYTLKWRKRKH